MNVASRMESTGMANQIQLSSITHTILQEQIQQLQLQQCLHDHHGIDVKCTPRTPTITIKGYEQPYPTYWFTVVDSIKDAPLSTRADLGQLLSSVLTPQGQSQRQQDTQHQSNLLVDIDESIISDTTYYFEYE